MELRIKSIYKLRHPIRIQGTEIDTKANLKLLHFDECIANVEVMNGPCDGLQFIVAPEALV